ncbi:MAG: hypothetical protein M1121_06665 [Actinobacteria bacterium]|nr:hypothetical protein [Actinomycetota bacterium]
MSPIHDMSVSAVGTGFDARCVCGYYSGLVASHRLATGFAHLHLAEVCLIEVNQVETSSDVIGSSPTRSDETAATLTSEGATS